MSVVGCKAAVELHVGHLVRGLLLFFSKLSRAQQDYTILLVFISLCASHNDARYVLPLQAILNSFGCISPTIWAPESGHLNLSAPWVAIRVG